MDYAYPLQKFGAFNAGQFQRPIAWKADDRKKFFQSLAGFKKKQVNVYTQ